jgi:hypothetical protein
MRTSGSGMKLTLGNHVTCVSLVITNLFYPHPGRKMQQGCTVGAVDSPGGGVRGWAQKRQRFLYNVQVTGC